MVRLFVESCESDIDLFHQHHFSSTDEEELIDQAH